MKTQREELQGKIEEVLILVRAGQMTKYEGTKDLFSLFIELGYEVIGDNVQVNDDMEDHAWDANMNCNILRNLQRKKLAELGGK